MSDEHVCQQAQRISHIERALFGIPGSDEDPGAIQLIKETHKTVKEMKPEFEIVKKAGIFAEVGKKVGQYILFLIIFFSAVITAVLGLREWFNKH